MGEAMFRPSRPLCRWAASEPPASEEAVRLREWRVAHKLTRKHLAQRLGGLDEHHVDLIEQGRLVPDPFTAWFDVFSALEVDD